MSKTRTIHFDATRAFMFSVIAVGLLGAAFASGFRLGQEVPVTLTESFTTESAGQAEHVEPLVAPVQRVPVETYTFYENTRTIEREAVEVPAAQRNLERDPNAVAAPADPAEGAAPTPERQAVVQDSVPEAPAADAAPAGGGVADQGGAGQGPASGGGVVPRSLDDGPSNPGAIERVAVVPADGE